MTTKHPEPWKVVDAECIYVVDANGTTVLEFEHEMEEEAWRIVRCINAVGYDREQGPDANALLDALARIRAAGYDNEIDPQAMVNAAEKLLDPDSIHKGDITSIASHFGLYT